MLNTFCVLEELWVWINEVVLSQTIRNNKEPERGSKGYLRYIIYREGMKTVWNVIVYLIAYTFCKEYTSNKYVRREHGITYLTYSQTESFFHFTKGMSSHLFAICTLLELGKPALGHSAVSWLANGNDVHDRNIWNNWLQFRWEKHVLNL